MKDLIEYLAIVGIILALAILGLGYAPTIAEELSERLIKSVKIERKITL